MGGKRAKMLAKVLSRLPIPNEEKHLTNKFKSRKRIRKKWWTSLSRPHREAILRTRNPKTGISVWIVPGTPEKELCPTCNKRKHISRLVVGVNGLTCLSCFHKN